MKGGGKPKMESEAPAGYRSSPRKRTQTHFGDEFLTPSVIVMKKRTSNSVQNNNVTQSKFVDQGKESASRSLGNSVKGSTHLEDDTNVTNTSPRRQARTRSSKNMVDTCVAIQDPKGNQVAVQLAQRRVKQVARKTKANEKRGRPSKEYSEAAKSHSLIVEMEGPGGSREKTVCAAVSNSRTMLPTNHVTDQPRLPSTRSKPVFQEPQRYSDVKKTVEREKNSDPIIKGVSAIVKIANFDGQENREDLLAALRNETGVATVAQGVAKDVCIHGSWQAVNRAYKFLQERLPASLAPCGDSSSGAEVEPKTVDSGKGDHSLTQEQETEDSVQSSTSKPTSAFVEVGYQATSSDHHRGNDSSPRGGNSDFTKDRGRDSDSTKDRGGDSDFTKKDKKKMSGLESVLDLLSKNKVFSSFGKGQTLSVSVPVVDSIRDEGELVNIEVEVVDSDSGPETGEETQTGCLGDGGSTNEVVDIGCIETSLTSDGEAVCREKNRGEGEVGKACCAGESTKAGVSVSTQANLHCHDNNLHSYAAEKSAIKKEDNSGLVRHYCDSCSNDFPTYSELVSHKNSHHKNFTCDICYKTFGLKRYLAVHMKRHAGIKKYSCPTCNMKFFERPKMTLHMESHKAVGERNLPYQCDICDHQFYNLASWKDHRNTHLGLKPYQCDLCPSSFAHRVGLSRHKQCHNPHKIYACQFCSKSFRFKSGLAAHKRKHTGDEKFICKDCGKTFTVGSSLKRHNCPAVRARKQADTLYMCGLCSQVFNTLHQATYHNCSNVASQPADNVLTEQSHIATVSSPSSDYTNLPQEQGYVQQAGDVTPVENLLVTSIPQDAGDTSSNVTIQYVDKLISESTTSMIGNQIVAFQTGEDSVFQNATVENLVVPQGAERGDLVHVECESKEEVQLPEETGMSGHGDFPARMEIVGGEEFTGKVIVSRSGNFPEVSIPENVNFLENLCVSGSEKHLAATTLAHLSSNV